VTSEQYAYAIPQILLGLLVVKPSTLPFLALRWIGTIAGILSSVLLSALVVKALEIKNCLLWLLGCISVFFFIPVLQTSFSFMTDIPAFFLWIISVWTLGNYLEKKTTSSWFLAFIVSTIAVAQRQLAILIPLSIIVFENRTWRPNQGWGGIRRVFGTSFPIMVFALPLLIIHAWWVSISPLARAPMSFSPNPGVLIRMLYHLMHLGWLVVPFTFLPKISTRDLSLTQQKLFKGGKIFILVSLAIAAVDCLLNKRVPLPPFFNNVLSEVGILPIVLGGFTEVIFSDQLRVLLLLVGGFGVFQILKGFSLVWCETNTLGLKRVIILSSLVYFIFICFRATHFDRYSIPMIPLCLLCLFRTCNLKEKISLVRRGLIGASIVIYAAFSCTLVADYFRWNEARWKAIDSALSKGIAKDDLWGGYEYFGWFNRLELWMKPKEFSYVISPTYDSGIFERVEVFAYPSFWNKKQKEMYLLKRREDKS